MASDVEISSLALSRIGQEKITSFSSTGNKASRWFNANYETIKRALLSEHPWNFAIKRATLSSATAPTNEYTNAYTLPTDFIRLVRLNGEAKAGYRVERNTLATYEASAVIEYVYDVTDEASFTASFTDLLAQRLAAEICYYITGSATTAEQAWSLYRAKLTTAKSVDSREAAPRYRSANMALSRLGETTRQGEDGANTIESAARIIEANYDTVRKALLREYPWNFAVKRVALVGATAPVNDYSNRFTLPTDFLRMVKLNASTEVTYRIEGGYLVTDASSATIEYIWNVTDEDAFSPDFLDVLAQRHAAEAAAAISPQVSQGMWNLYQAKLAQAKATDSRESAPRKKATNLAVLKLGEVAGRGGEDAAIARENANRVAESLWESSRKSLLREHAWNFAVKRAAMSSGSATSGEFSYAHSLPADFIRAVRINDAEDAYRIEGTSILSNLSSYTLEYVYDVTDETKFDPQFQEVLAQRIAAEASVSLNPGAANAMWTVYQQKLASARAVDGREAKPLKKACALAMLKLGEVAGRQGDDALTARETATRTVEGLWDSCRAALLREHPWNFAIKRASLSSTTTPVNDFAYAFTLPADFVRMVRLNASATVTWRVEGARLLTDSNSAVVEYVYSVTDEALFDAQFSELLAQRIAAEAAAALNPGAASALWTVYQQKLSVAREVDGREAAPRKIAVNLALLKLGDVAGKAGNDALAAREAAARTAEGLWDSCRKALLREHAWNFAIAGTALVEVSAGIFTLPSNCLKVIRINNGADDFRVTGGGVLITTAATATIEFVQDIMDEALFDALFLELLAQRIAAEAAASINPTAAQALWTIYQQKLSTAKYADSNEMAPQRSAARLALLKLGEVSGKAGDDLSVTRENASRVVDGLWDSCRRSLLREHAWNFATKYASLAVVSGNQYSLPSDFIRAIRLNTEGAAPFQIAGAFLYTSVTSPSLEYIYDLTDDTKFDPQFDEVLAQRIAAEAAVSINPGAAGAMWSIYQQKLQAAIIADTTEAKPYGVVGKLAESRLGEVAGRGGAEHLLTRERVKRTIEANSDYVRKALLREHPWNFAIRRAVLTRDTIRTITAITAANPVVVTSAGHGFANGDTVYLAGILGMTELNNRTFTVANQATNTFQLSGENGTAYTAYSSGGSAYAYIAKEYGYRFAVPASCLRMVRINGCEADEYRLEGGYVYTNEETVHLEYIADVSDEAEFDSSFTDVLATRLAAEVAVALNPGAAGALWASYEAKMLQARTNNAREGTPRDIEAYEWLAARA